MSKGTGDILLPVQTLNFSFTMTTSTERHMTCEEAGCVFTFYFKHIQRLKVSQILVMLPMAKWDDFFVCVGDIFHPADCTFNNTVICV